MDVGERCYKKFDKIDEVAPTVTGHSTFGSIDQMNVARTILRNIMTNKLVRGSTGYNIMRRAEDPIRGWAELYTWYTEISGHGRNAIMHTLFRPTPAAKDSEVIDKLLKWEDEYADGLKRGIDDITDHSKIQVLWDIATQPLREKLDEEDFDKYLDARRFVMNWGTNKRREENDKKTKSNKMDIGNLDASNNQE